MKGGTVGGRCARGHVRVDYYQQMRKRGQGRGLAGRRTMGKEVEQFVFKGQVIMGLTGRERADTERRGWFVCRRHRSFRHPAHVMKFPEGGRDPRPFTSAERPRDGKHRRVYVGVVLTAVARKVGNALTPRHADPPASSLPLAPPP